MGTIACSSPVSQLATKAKVAIVRVILSKARAAYFTFISHVTLHPVRELFQPPWVETKPLWEFDQTLSQRSDWVKGLARVTSPLLGPVCLSFMIMCVILTYVPFL